MPDRSPPVTLRVVPSTIPAVRRAFDEALAELSQHLRRLRTEGYLHEPWLGDDISRMVQSHYNRRVMDAADGPYAALLAYEAELLNVSRTLQRMEDDYRRTEGDNVELWGRA